MTLVLCTSKAQLLLILLFTHKLRICWCLQINITLQNILICFSTPSPGMQRWEGKCAQEFSVKGLNQHLFSISCFFSLITNAMFKMYRITRGVNICTSYFQFHLVENFPSCFYSRLNEHKTGKSVAFIHKIY